MPTTAMPLRMLRGDAHQRIASVPEQSVDLVLTDPPYGQTDCDWDVPLDFTAIWPELLRCLRQPGGAIVLHAIQPFASELVTSFRSHFRFDLIWHKTTPVGFLNANRQPLRAHEHILVFAPRAPRYNPQFTPCKPRVQRNGPGRRTAIYHGGWKRDIGPRVRTHFYPRSVLTFANRPGPDKRTWHPTQKPVDLLSWLIRTFTDPGQTVLDFTMGSGSTAIACLRTGRRFIGIEKESRWVAVARQRLHEERRLLARELVAAA